jgi:hypothetical protein
MAETRKHSVVVKLVDTDQHDLVIDGGSTEERINAFRVVDPTISTEDHTLTITNS